MKHYMIMSFKLTMFTLIVIINIFLTGNVLIMIKDGKFHL